MITDRGDRWFFVYGFEKSVRANIFAEDLGLREIAKQLVDRTSAQLDQYGTDRCRRFVDEKNQGQGPILQAVHETASDLGFDKRKVHEFNALS